MKGSAAFALGVEAGRDEVFDIGRTHDPEDVTAGVDERVIHAGMEAHDKIQSDLENYVSGKTIDWDDGMMVAYIFKQMLKEQARITT